MTVDMERETCETTALNSKLFKENNLKIEERIWRKNRWSIFLCFVILLRRYTLYSYDVTLKNAICQEWSLMQEEAGGEGCNP